MSSLSGRRPRDTYGDLLRVENAGGGLDATLRAVEDGAGHASALQVSTTGIKVAGTLETSANVKAGTDTFLAYIDAGIHGGLWLTSNAYWDGGHWQRVDTSRIAFALNIRANVNIPGEAATKGIIFWKAQAGTNPISDTYAAVGGWEALNILTEFKDQVFAGFAIELDGNGTVPYGRLMHNVLSGVVRTGTMTNWFADFSDRDDTTKPSWSQAIRDDAWAVERWPAGLSPTPVTLLSADLTAARVAVPMQLPGYATGGLPSASAAGAGAMAYCTTVGEPVFSDGSTWRRCSDKTAV